MAALVATAGTAIRRKNGVTWIVVLRVPALRPALRRSSRCPTEYDEA